MRELAARWVAAWWIDNWLVCLTRDHDHSSLVSWVVVVVVVVGDRTNSILHADVNKTTLATCSAPCVAACCVV